MMDFDRTGQNFDGNTDAADSQAQPLTAAEMVAQAANAAAAAAQAVAGAGVNRVVPGADGVVVLPDGVSLDDIKVSGRDLVISLPGGGQMVIVDGAVLVPQLVIGGVEVPPLNLAALLIGQEPQPAAGGAVQSSGGNFAVPVGDIGDPFGLGDLLPPTELAFSQPQEEEVLLGLIDEEPTTVIITPDNPAGASSATSSVSEAGLPARGNEPAGSNAASNSETVTGTIAYVANDGLGSITLNGVAITQVGQVITTPLGALTITSIAPGAVGYSYTLTDNSTAANPTDVFAVVVTDADGDAATANLTITINDDAPTARPDTDSVAAGTYGPETGNVMTGAGTTSGATGVDTQGADGAVVTGVRLGETGAFTAVGAGGATINGQYGVLTISANGSYSYVRNANAPGGVTDTFGYQITDGDGDTSTTTLAISIADSAPAITFIPAAGDAGAVVAESGLPPRGTESPGSNQQSNSETTAGTITYTSPDGPATVSINGTAVTAVGQVISSPTGQLTITSIAPGAIGYSFTLADNTSGDDTSQTFDVTITDADGDTTSAPLVIDIIDDVPTARDDSAAAQEDTPITINVFANDTPGADSVDVVTKISLTTPPAKGTAVYNGDGTFTYTPTPGQEGSDSFTYTIIDGDGDPSTATVTITLAQDSRPVFVSADSQVDEAGLPPRGSEPPGSNEPSNSETTTGTLTFTGGNDTLASLTIGGVNVTNGGTVAGQYGTLTVTNTNGAYTYSYTLADNTSGNNTAENFNVVAVDSDGDIANDTLTIDIIDDEPTARDDTDTVPAASFAAETGNVITGVGTTSGPVGADTLGADGATVTHVAHGATTVAAGQQIAGDYGVLTLGSNGEYSYVRNPGTPSDVTEVFLYTLTDGDGDVSQATLTFTIGDSTPTTNVPAPGGPTTTVYEAALAVRPGETEGTGEEAAPGANGDPRETVSGTITFSSPDGVGTVSLGGTAITPGNLPQTVASNATGTLVVTSFTYDPATGFGSIGYSYTLLDNTLTDPSSASFPLVFTDSDGDAAAPKNLVITIVDDAPIARADVDSVGEDGPLVADGNVLTGVGGGTADSQGADGAHLVSIAFGQTAGTLGAPLAGNYGSVVVDANGNYVYTLNPNHPSVQTLSGGETLTEIFTYGIVDGDGDPATTTLTIIINGNDDGVSINGLDGQGAEEVVNEDDLQSGSSPDAPALTQAGDFSVTTPDGLDDVTIGGVSVVANGVFTPRVIDTPAGVLNIQTFTPTVAPDGTITGGTFSYTYVLQNNVLTHPNQGEDSIVESFLVTLTDTDGSSDTASLDIQVIDDVPTARNDDATAGENVPVVINVMTNDTPGADGVSLVNGVALGTGPTKGTAVYNGNGTFTYTAGPGAEGTDSFTYTITDGDGDTSTATVTITLTSDSKPTVSATDLTVNEAGLPARGPDDAGTNAASNSEQASGQLTIATGNDTLSKVEIQNAQGTWIDVTGGGSVQGNDGTLVVTVNAGVYSYTYTLTDNLENHPDNIIDGDGDRGADDPLAGDSFAVRVTDNENDVSPTDTINVTVLDDGPVITQNTPAAPLLSVDETNLAGNDSEDFSTKFNMVFGADGPAAGGGKAFTLGVVAGPSGLVDSETGNAVLLRVNPAGTEVEGYFGGGAGTVVFKLTIDPATGVATLDQQRAVMHSPDTGPDQPVSLASNLITLTATLTDGDGDKASSTLSIGDRLEFRDDAPVLTVSDTPTTATEGATVNGTWTLAPGADGVTSVAVSFGGAAGTLNLPAGTDVVLVQPTGTLTVRANGTFSFQAALGQDNDLSPQATFTLTATDRDGDVSSDSMTIAIEDGRPAGNAQPITLQVDEAALAVIGSNPNSNAETDNSPTLSFTAGSDALTTFRFSTDLSNLVANIDGAGTDLFWTRSADGQTITGSLTNGGPAAITLAITSAGTINPGDSGNVTVTVTLADNLPHETALLAQVASLGYAIVEALDNDGDVATGQVNVEVKDDVPTAQNDIANSGENAPVVINVLTNDTPGADGVALIGGVALGTAPTKGTAVYNDNGTFTYTPNPGAEGADSFTYTITDGDGDTSTATVNLTLTADSKPTVSATDLTVNEAGLPARGPDDAGTNAASNSEQASGQLTIATGNDTLAKVEIQDKDGNWVNVTAGGNVQGNDGTLVVTVNAGVYSYTYTLTDNLENHPDNVIDGDGDRGADDPLAGDSFAVRVTDNENDVSPTDTINVTVLDDGPVITQNTPAAPLLSVDETNLAGNDSEDFSTKFNMVFGADGPAAGGGKAFTLGVVAGPSGLVDSVTGNAVLLRVNPAGTEVEGYFGGGAGTVVFKLTIDPATGVATLDQQRAVMHSPDTGPDQPVSLASNLITLTATLTDGDGDKASSTLSIGDRLEFRDDAPVLTVSDTPTTATEGATVNGTWTLAPGADGVTSVAVSFGGAAGTLNLPAGTDVVLAQPTGTLTVRANGTFSFQAALGQDNDLSPQATFTLTATDRDGDVSSDSLTIAIQDGTPAGNAAPITLQVDEAALAVIGSNPSSNAEVDASPTLSFTAGSDALTSFQFSTNLSGLVTDLNGGGQDLFWTRSADGQTITGSLTNGGPAAITLAITSAGTINAGNSGNVTVTVTLADNLPHASGLLAQVASLGSAIVEARDNDGNVATGQVNVEVKDDVPSVTASAAAGNTAVVDESGPGAAPSITTVSVKGDDPNVAGSNALGKAVSAGSVVNFTPTYGADGQAGQPVLELVVTTTLSNLTLTDGTAINLVKEGNVIVGKVASGTFVDKAAFAIAIDADGKITVEQYLSLKHPTPGNPDEPVTLATDSIGVKVTIADTDGDTATSSTVDISAKISFEDDAPGAFTPTTANVTNAAGPATAPIAANFAANAGADGPGDLVFKVTNGTQLFDTNSKALQFGGEEIYLQNKAGSDGHVVEGRTADGDLAFTATLNPGGDSYTIDLEGPIYNIDQFSFTNVSGTVGGGNVNYKGLGVGSLPNKDILISGNGSVNTNSTEIGISSGNDIGNGDVIRFDMVLNLATAASAPANGNTGFTHTGHYEVGTFVQEISRVTGGGNNTSGITVTIKNGDGDFSYLGDGTGESATPNITVKVYSTDPTTGNPTPVATFTNNAGNSVAVTGMKEGYWIEVTSTDPFSVVEYTNKTGTDFKLGAVKIETANILEPFDFNLPVTGKDGDGDGVDSNITVHLTPPVVPPVVLDLDGNGVQFLDQSAGVAFDYDGNGSPNKTAWVGPNDGLLAIDKNGDGVISDASELVFGGNGQTDLQGLAANYDSNGDGILSAADADFGRFGVWQDANSNGVTDPGEFRSLTAAGIVSLSLTSDGISYTAANDQVIVHGETRYTKADSSTGIAADAAFLTGGAKEDQKAASANANPGFGQALVAAGLVAAQAASATPPTPPPPGTDHGDPAAGDTATSAAPQVDTARAAPQGGTTDSALDDQPAKPAASTSHASHGEADAPAPALHAANDGDGQGASTPIDQPADVAADAPAPVPSFVDMAALPAIPAVAAEHAAVPQATVAEIVAEALDQPKGPDIDALLAKLPGAMPSIPDHPVEIAALMAANHDPVAQAHAAAMAVTPAVAAH